MWQYRFRKRALAYSFDEALSRRKFRLSGVHVIGNTYGDWSRALSRSGFLGAEVTRRGGAAEGARSDKGLLVLDVEGGGRVEVSTHF